MNEKRARYQTLRLTTLVDLASALMHVEAVLTANDEPRCLAPALTRLTEIKVAQEVGRCPT